MRFFASHLRNSIFNLQFLSLDMRDFVVCGAGVQQSFVQFGFQFAVAHLKLGDMRIGRHAYLAGSGIRSMTIDDNIESAHCLTSNRILG